MLEINQSRQVAYLFKMQEHEYSEHTEAMIIAELHLVKDFTLDRVNLLRYFNDLRNDLSDIEAYQSVIQSIDSIISRLIDFFAVELIVLQDDIDYRKQLLKHKK